MFHELSGFVMYWFKDLIGIWFWFERVELRTVQMVENLDAELDVVMWFVSQKLFFIFINVTSFP